MLDCGEWAANVRHAVHQGPALRRFIRNAHSGACKCLLIKRQPYANSLSGYP
jgi:hypothetical protein